MHFGSFNRRVPEVAHFARQQEAQLKTACDPGDLKLYSRSPHYPSLRAARLLGYQAAFDQRCGLRLTTEWLHHQGCLEAVLSKIVIEQGSVIATLDRLPVPLTVVI
jgi:hypothetical protein